MNFQKKLLFVKYILLFFLLMIGVSSAAQKYGNALGVRLGNDDRYRTAGLSFQQRLLSDFTIEGIAQTDFTKNTTFHALFEYHRPIVTKRLNYYVGAGLMTGVEEDRVKDKITKIETVTYGNSVFGADLVAGIEITMLKFNVSFDYKPNFNITGRESWYQGQVGVSVRAVMLSGAKFDKMRRERAREKRKAKREDNKENNPLKTFFEKDIFH